MASSLLSCGSSAGSRQMIFSSAGRNISSTATTTTTRRGRHTQSAASGSSSTSSFYSAISTTVAASSRAGPTSSALRLTQNDQRGIQQISAMMSSLSSSSACAAAGVNAPRVGNLNYHCWTGVSRPILNGRTFASAPPDVATPPYSPAALLAYSAATSQGGPDSSSTSRDQIVSAKAMLAALLSVAAATAGGSIFVGGGGHSTSTSSAASSFKDAFKIGKGSGGGGGGGPGHGGGSGGPAAAPFSTRDDMTKEEESYDEDNEGDEAAKDVAESQEELRDAISRVKQAIGYAAASGWGTRRRLKEQPKVQPAYPKTYDVSVRAIKGGRLSMEDEYFIGKGGRFVAVYDGHGGGGVSGLLRERLYDAVDRYLHDPMLEENRGDVSKNGGSNNPSISCLVAAIRSAFEDLEREILLDDSLQYQGSTAVAVAVHEGEDGHRTLLSANVGDSRAVLSRRQKAVDLTRDHKPNDEREKARILAMGETIEWDHYCKVHRVRNLSLSRAIGDRFAKPAVSGEVEIKRFPIAEDGDEFILLASDGLWDVMTSQEAVSYVHRRLQAPPKPGTACEGDMERWKETKRKNMSRYLANEALRRGSGDNICVVIVWLKDLE